jgi:two-component system sensor histidine kinase KdpD
LLHLLISLVMVGVVSAVLFWLDQATAVDLVPIAYLLPVVIAATQWGIWPATVASIASVAAADFLFFPPIYSFELDNPHEVIDLLLFLVVALVSSNLASRLRQEAERLRRREQEMQHLYEFSRRLAACFSVADLISAIQNYLSYALGQQALFLAAKSDGHLELSDSGPLPPAVHQSVASMVANGDMTSCNIVDEATYHCWVLEAVRSQTAVLGVVAVNIGDGTHEALESRKHRVKDILEETSLTFQRLDLARAMEDARLHLQAQLLQDAFHGMLAHELYSPLAAIRGSASVLDSIPMIQSDDRTRSLVEAISDQAAHLGGFIHNILNATRVTAGGISPRLEWADPRDVVKAAITARGRRLTAHKLVVAFSENLPLINVDSGLVEEAFGQLLENAAKYSPSGSTISIDARAEHGSVVLSIADQGVGITPDERRHLGRRSFRSQRHQATIPGAGLGFWIASTFVKTNGGTIDISSPGRGKGTTACITLPGSCVEASELADLSDE